METCGKFLLETRDPWILSSFLSFHDCGLVEVQQSSGWLNSSMTRTVSAMTLSPSFSALVTGGWSSGVIHSFSGFCWYPSLQLLQGFQLWCLSSNWGKRSQFNCLGQQDFRVSSPLPFGVINISEWEELLSEWSL